MIRTAATCGAVLVLYAVPAAAQTTMTPWRDIVFLNISPAAQSSTKEISADFVFPYEEEDATVGVTRTVKGSSFFDVTVGAALVNNIGAALSIFTRSAASDGTLTASVPDPAQFNVPRNVTATLGGMAHRETWVGIQGVYGFGVGPKLDVMVLGGPAVAKVEHDVVSGTPTVTETGSRPNPRVNVNVVRASKSFWGFMVGADVRYMLATVAGGKLGIGVGGFFRFASAPGSLDDGGPTLDVGGPQFGGGLRIRY